MAYSLDFTTSELVQWLNNNDVDHEDCLKVSEAKLRGGSFILMDKEEYFKELGLPLGTRLHFQSLIEKAKRETSVEQNSQRQPGGPPPPRPAPAKPPPASAGHKITANILCTELISVVDWKKLAMNLGIDASLIQIFTKDNKFDIGEQKMTLFTYIEKNHRDLGITWESICQSLEGFEGNLAHSLKQKYCNPSRPPPDISAELSTEDPGMLGHRHLRAILEVVFEVRSRWRFFAMELEMLPPDLDAIDIVGKSNPDECLRQVLELWIRRDNPPPHFTDILAALRAPTINQGGLANRIERFSLEKKQKIGFNL